MLNRADKWRELLIALAAEGQGVLLRRPHQESMGSFTKDSNCLVACKGI
jgi:hypothetical protein